MEPYESLIPVRVNDIVCNYSSTDVNWFGNEVVIKLFSKYFKHKYKTCVIDLQVYFETQSSLFGQLGISIQNPHFSSGFELDGCIERINRCLQSSRMTNRDVVFINFLFFYKKNPDDKYYSGHANLLIYRPNERTLEWFEPHGECFMLNKNHHVTIQVKDLVTRFSKKLGANLIEPYQISKSHGLQVQECKSVIPANSPGYCALWCFFFMEMMLTFPDYSATQINNAITINFNHPDQFRELMLSYSNKLSNILEKYHHITLNEVINEIHKSNDEANDFVQKIRKSIKEDEDKHNCRRNSILHVPYNVYRMFLRNVFDTNTDIGIARAQQSIGSVNSNLFPISQMSQDTVFHNDDPELIKITREAAEAQAAAEAAAQDNRNEDELEKQEAEALREAEEQEETKVLKTRKKKTSKSNKNKPVSKYKKRGIKTATTSKRGREPTNKHKRPRILSSINESMELIPYSNHNNVGTGGKLGNKRRTKKKKIVLT